MSSATNMACFEPEQTPSRTGVAGHSRSRRYRQSTSSSCGPRPTVQPLSGSSVSNISAVNHRIQHHEDELQEMKFRQQRLEEQLLSVQKENDVLRKEVSKVQEQIQPPGRDKKQRLPSELSRRVRELHTSLSEEEQYDPGLNVTLQRNGRVREHLVSLLKESYSDRYSPKQYKDAATRLYTGLRREFRESQPQQESRVDNQRRARKKRARQQRKYNRRRRRVRQSEKKYFAHVKVCHMTEEESEGESTLIMRPISWRSDEYNRFLKTLDDRAEADRPLAGVAVRCQRVTGPPSNMIVPSDLPQWMIRESIEETEENALFNSYVVDDGEGDGEGYGDLSEHGSQPSSPIATPISTQIGVTNALLDAILND